MKRLLLLAFMFSGCDEAMKSSADSAVVADSMWRAQDAALLDAEDTAGWQCGGRSEEGSE